MFELFKADPNEKQELPAYYNCKVIIAVKQAGESFILKVFGQDNDLFANGAYIDDSCIVIPSDLKDGIYCFTNIVVNVISRDRESNYIDDYDVTGSWTLVFDYNEYLKNLDDLQCQS